MDAWAWVVEHQGLGGSGQLFAAWGWVSARLALYPWSSPHFLCLISLFQLSPSCLLCSSSEGLFVPVGQLTFGT